jgi:hypothetical protein
VPILAILPLVGPNSFPNGDSIMPRLLVLTANSKTTPLSRLPTPPKLLVFNAWFTFDFAKIIKPYVDAVVGADGRIGDQSGNTFCQNLLYCFRAVPICWRCIFFGEEAVNIAGYEDSKVELDHREGSDPEKLIFYARPELMAAFELTEEGNPKKVGGDYQIELRLRGVAFTIDTVTYQVCHPSFKEKDRFWEIAGATSPEFATDDFSSYGDVTIRAVAWFRDRGIGIESTLLTALNRYYGDSPSAEIGNAIGDIAAR